MILIMHQAFRLYIVHEAITILSEPLICIETTETVYDCTLPKTTDVNNIASLRLWEYKIVRGCRQLKKVYELVEHAKDLTVAERSLVLR
jgi:hypothetical protein